MSDPQQQRKRKDTRLDSKSQEPKQKEPKSKGPKSKDESNQEPGKRLIQVLGKKLVRLLAIGSFVGGILLLLFVILCPTVISSSEIARGGFCLLIALLFSVFVFTLYPSDYKLKTNKLKIGIAIVLVGPAALWMALFFIFLKKLPREVVMETMFLPESGHNEITFANSWVLDWKPGQPRYYKIKISEDQNSTDPKLLAGFYVTFDQANNKYTARIGIGPSRQEVVESYEVVFVRGASTYRANAVSQEGENR